MKRPSFIFSLIFAAGMPALAHAQAFDDGSDSFDIPEVDVIFKCHKDEYTMEGAAGGLAGKLAESKERVYGALLYPSESRFAYVAAPYKISGPAFFEQDGVKIACVTVQSVKSLSENDSDAAEETVVEADASAPEADATPEAAVEPAAEPATDEAPVAESTTAPIAAAPDFSSVRDGNDITSLEPAPTAEAEPLEAIEAQPVATDALPEPEATVETEAPAAPVATEEPILAPIDMGEDDAPVADAPAAPVADAPEAPVADAPAAPVADAPEAPIADGNATLDAPIAVHSDVVSDGAAVEATGAQEPNAPIVAEPETASVVPEAPVTPAATEAQDAPVVVPQSDVTVPTAPVVTDAPATEEAPAAPVAEAPEAPVATDSNTPVIVATPEVQATLDEAQVEAPVVDLAADSNGTVAPSSEAEVIPTYLDPNGFDAAPAAPESAPVSDVATSSTDSETLEPTTAEALNPNGATPAAISPTVVPNEAADEAASTETVQPAADVDNAEAIEDRREAAFWAGFDD